LKSSPLAIASGMPNSDAEGQPLSAGANVSQMERSTRCWREESFMDDAQV
jgi:hypothetical protein